MGWNHRVMKSKDGEDDYYQIHEVYYNNKGEPDSWTTNGVTVGAESVEGLRWVLEKMLESLDKEVLDYDRTSN